MNKKTAAVDGFLRKAKKWQKELATLRDMLLDSPLTEEVKWMHPCYTFEGGNVAILGGFKDYCMLNFVKGALLKDAKKILIPPGQNSQSSRVIRFTSVQQITDLRPVLKKYVDEAIKLEKSGAKVTLKKITEFKVPEELQAKLDERPDLKAAFTALTPGRQRAYLLHFSSAKQSKTREARVAKCVPKILRGKGLDDE